MYNNKTRKDSEGIVLRHPALTRFFAAFLAVVSVLTLISGGICIRKAADSREKQNTNTARLSEKTAEAKELCAEIAAAPVEFERQSAAYDEAKARYDSIYGTVESGWEKQDGKTVFTVTVPANCEASVHLPDGSERVQKPGSATYSI